MSKHDLFYLYDVPTHDDIKDTLLLYFDELTQKHTLNNNPSRNISATDYFHKEYGGRPPYNFLVMDHLVSIVINNMLPIYSCKSIEYQGCWFQQYHTGSDFSYHNHPRSHFAGIYYIELPEGCQTEFLGFEPPEVREGQLLIFPSYLVHRSPPNLNTERKSVIAFNFSIMYGK